MRKLALLLFAVGLAFAVYQGTQHRRAKPVRPAGAQPPLPQAPALTLVDLSGRNISTSSYAGHVVLINFWAAWCTPCAEEVPQFVALQDKYRLQGFQVIGISMDDKESALRAFYEKYRMNYPVIPGSQKIADAYGGVLGLPTSFLISRDGRVHAKYAGLADFAKLEQEIIALLHSDR
jgi:cytochrome c biogenesis protein CcmG/thiol:disulfide interchange protein DsbE